MVVDHLVRLLAGVHVLHSLLVAAGLEDRLVRLFCALALCSEGGEGVQDDGGAVLVQLLLGEQLGLAKLLSSKTQKT